MKRPSPHISEIADIYIDESSQTKHTFLVLGGIIVPTADVHNFVTGAQQSRLPELPEGEAKWTKVSRTKLPAYKRLVDFFFDSQASRRCDFHSVVINTDGVDNKHYNDGSREIGFNKEVYQLANKFGRLYPFLFHLYPDYRDTNQSPDDLRLILNRGRKKSGDRRDWPFRRCQFRHSDKCIPLQITDILTGGLAYALNGHNNATGASPAKIELSEYIRNRAGITNVMVDTHISGKFTVWHRKLQPRVPRP